MKKIYYFKCKRYREFKNLEISNIFYKTLAISIVCGKCGSKCKRIFTEGEPIDILKFLGLIKNIELLWKFRERKRKTLD